MNTTTKIFKTLLAIGLISTVKIAANLLKEDPPKKEPKESIEIEKTDLSEILSNIRAEMGMEYDEVISDTENTEGYRKMIKQYIKGRLDTVDDIEKRLC